MRILAVADIVEPQLYSNSLKRWIGPVDLIVSCGDLPPYYLDFLTSTLNVTLLHVIGNHCYAPHDPVTRRCSPSSYPGAVNLSGRLGQFNGLLVAGLEGSPLYNEGPHQYSEKQVAVILLRMVPGLILNKTRTGRYLDVFVTHSPPRGIQDNTDLPHRGFVPLVPFLERFKPVLLLHGHTHRYDFTAPMRTNFGETLVVNAYGHTIINLKEEGQGVWHLQNPLRSEV